MEKHRSPEMAGQPMTEGPAPQGALRTYTSLQAHFLTRLQRLVALQKAGSSRRDPVLMKALQRAIYATFMDCISQGVGEEARALLRELREGEKARP